MSEGPHNTISFLLRFQKNHSFFPIHFVFTFFPPNNDFNNKLDSDVEWYKSEVGQMPLPGELEKDNNNNNSNNNNNNNNKKQSKYNPLYRKRKRGDQQEEQGKHQNQKTENDPNISQHSSNKKQKTITPNNVNHNNNNNKTSKFHTPDIKKKFSNKK